MFFVPSSSVMSALPSLASYYGDRYDVTLFSVFILLIRAFVNVQYSNSHKRLFMAINYKICFWHIPNNVFSISTELLKTV
jgi:hypothetical protein